MVLSQSVLKESELDSSSQRVATTDACGFVIPPELMTGHSRLDFDHQQLLACMARLDKICAQQNGGACGGCRQTSEVECRDNLIGLLGDILAFILDHFQREERVMRDSLMMMVDRDVCEAHMEDHAAISAKVQEIVAALDLTQTPLLIDELKNLLQSWVTNHIVMHDLWLARWVQREVSMLAPAPLR